MEDLSQQMRGAQNVAFNEQDLERMDWSTLVQLRKQFNDDTEKQELIGPYEHQAFMRDKVADAPILALPYLAITAGYTAAKALGLHGGRSPASLAELGRGAKGIYEGLLAADSDKNVFQPVVDSFKESYQIVSDKVRGAMR